MTTPCGRSRRSTSSRSSSGPRCRRKLRMSPWVRILLQDYHIPCQPQRATQETPTRAPRPSALLTPRDLISVSSQSTINSTCTTTSSPLPTTRIHIIKASSHRHTKLTSRLRAKCTSTTFQRGKTLRRQASAHIIHRQSQPV